MKRSIRDLVRDELRDRSRRALGQNGYRPLITNQHGDLTWLSDEHGNVQWWSVAWRSYPLMTFMRERIGAAT